MNEDFAQALDEVRREREAFVVGLGEFLAECVSQFAPPASLEGFEEYFERNAPAAAAMLAERAGVQIAARGGEAMLTLKSVRMWVGVAMSLACVLTLEGRAMRAEEANEVVHAISGAAAADTLVTADARALPWLSRAAIDGPRTTNLKGFLTRTAQSMGE